MDSRQDVESNELKQAEWERARESIKQEMEAGEKEHDVGAAGCVGENR